MARAAYRQYLYYFLGDTKRSKIHLGFFSSVEGKVRWGDETISKKKRTAYVPVGVFPIQQPFLG